MNNRIKKFIEVEQLTPAKLADKLEVQRSNISHILSGRNKPGFDFIEKMLYNFPQLNPDWLILGKGEIYRNADKIDLFNQTTVNSVKRPYKYADEEEYNEQTSHTTSKSSETLNINTPTHNPKKIERVIIFYTDKTFETYTSG